MNRRSKGTILALTVAAFFSTMVARLVISPLIPDIIGAFETSKSATGLALTGMWAAYALLQFPSGILGERYGERTIVLLALCLTGLGSILTSIAPSYMTFAVFVIFLGTGAGLYFSASSSLLVRHFENTGQALGFQSAGGPLAGLLAPIAAAYIGEIYGWRIAVLLGAAVALPVFVLYWWQVPPTPPQHPERSLAVQFQPGLLVKLLSRPQIAYTTVLAILSYFAWQAFASFFPTFLIEYRGFSSQRASVVFGAVFALAAIGLPILGRVSDRVGRDTILALSLASNTIGYVLIIDGSGLMTTVLGVATLGFGMSWGGVLNSRFMDCFSDSERGTGFGLVRMVGLLVSSLGSVVVGTLAQRVNWPIAYGLVAGLLAFAALTLVLNRTLRLGL